jgi:hypothetical protein
MCRMQLDAVTLQEIGDPALLDCRHCSCTLVYAAAPVEIRSFPFNQ